MSIDIGRLAELVERAAENGSGLVIMPHEDGWDIVGMRTAGDEWKVSPTFALAVEVALEWFE